MRKTFDSEQLSERLLAPFQAALKDAARVLEINSGNRPEQNTAISKQTALKTHSRGYGHDTTEQQVPTGFDHDNRTHASSTEHHQSVKNAPQSPITQRASSSSSVQQSRPSTERISRFQPIINHSSITTNAPFLVAQAQPASSIPDRQHTPKTSIQTVDDQLLGQADPRDTSGHLTGSRSYADESRTPATPANLKTSAASETTADSAIRSPQHGDVPISRLAPLQTAPRTQASENNSSTNIQLNTSIADRSETANTVNNPQLAAITNTITDTALTTEQRSAVPLRRLAPIQAAPQTQTPANTASTTNESGTFGDTRQASDTSLPASESAGQTRSASVGASSPQSTAITPSDISARPSSFAAIRNPQISEPSLYERAGGIPLGVAMPQTDNIETLPAASPQSEPLSRLASSLDHSLEQAGELSQAQLESASRVSNIFNVNVAVNDTASKHGIDLLTLQQALADVLYASARRHGLDI